MGFHGERNEDEGAIPQNAYEKYYRKSSHYPVFSTITRTSLDCFCQDKRSGNR